MNKFTRKDFLETLFHDYFRKREGFILVKTIRNFDKKVSTRYFPNVEILAKEQYLSDQNVFFGVCPLENMKPDKAYMQYLVALWCGLDLSPEGYSGKQVYFFGQAQAAKAVRSFPLPPSIIVESGQGLHLYWLLKHVTRIEDSEAVENILKGINTYFQCNAPVGIDSLMRLPETTNVKLSSNGFRCKAKYINPDFRYDLEEFEKLDLGLSAVPAKDDSLDESRAEGPSDLSVPYRDQTFGPSVAAHDRSEELDEDSDDYEDAGSLMDSGEISSMVIGPDSEESQTVVVLAEESADLIADEIVDKVVDRLTDKLMEQLVDQIVEKLVQRLTGNK